MAHQRSYGIEFKRQIVQEYLGGEALNGLAKRHRISRNLIRLWTLKYEAGEFSDDAAVASTLAEYEARMALLERKVGQLALENDLLKKTLPRSRSTNAEPCSIVSGPVISVSRKDAGS
jgi:transposase